ncbi:MAG: DsbA family protein [Candidatus Woesearchaeota archaeon]|nr:DsbA family protein [Candidatus Woesearchaeota archaeon]
MEKQQTIIILLSLMVILQLVTAYGIFQLGKTGLPAAAPAAQPAAQPEKQPVQQPPAPAAKVEVSAENDEVKGEANAPVLIVEFSDYQCPFCSRVEASLKQVEEKYIKTGKVKIVYRDYPLGFHDKAQKAAEASECAHDQGKFWEYHDKLFANQNALDIFSLKQYAKDLKLDTAKFDKCLDSGEKAAEVSKDTADANAAGVSGTPIFFINGVALKGAQPYDSFETAIEAALKG